MNFNKKTKKKPINYLWNKKNVVYIACTQWPNVSFAINSGNSIMKGNICQKTWKKINNKFLNVSNALISTMKNAFNIKI